MNCFSCNNSLVKGAHFCPNCGVATVHNVLIEGKSTANFDPLNRNFKPWRDLPLIPKRNYKSNDDKGNKSVSVKLPWCPPMRSLHPRKLKTKKSFNSSNALPAIPSALSEPNNTEATTCTNIENSEIEVSSETEEPKTKITDSVDRRYYCTEKASPIAVYDGTWLVNTQSAVSINVSLVEQSLTQTNRSFWLRIGVFADSEEDSDDIHCTAAAHEDQTQDKNRISKSEVTGLQVLCFLSNEVAKLIYPTPADWVDLFAIDAREYYMGQYMQRMLEVVAARVTPVNKRTATRNVIISGTSSADHFRYLVSVHSAKKPSIYEGEGMDGETELKEEREEQREVDFEQYLKADTTVHTIAFVDISALGDDDREALIRNEYEKLHGKPYYNTGSGSQVNPDEHTKDETLVAQASSTLSPTTESATAAIQYKPESVTFDASIEHVRCRVKTTLLNKPKTERRRQGPQRKRFAWEEDEEEQSEEEENTIDYLMAQVSLSVVYLNRRDYSNNNNVSNSSNNAASFSSTDSSSNNNNNINLITSQEFEHSLLATHITLHITPYACDRHPFYTPPSEEDLLYNKSYRHVEPTSDLPSCSVSIEGSSLPPLLNKFTVKTPTRVLSKRFSIEEVLHFAIDDRKVLHNFIRQLVRLVRLEYDYSYHTYKYIFIGSFYEQRVPLILLPPDTSMSVYLEQLITASREKLLPPAVESDSEEETYTPEPYVPLNVYSDEELYGWECSEPYFGKSSNNNNNNNRTEHSQSNIDNTTNNNSNTSPNTDNNQERQSNNNNTSDNVIISDGSELIAEGLNADGSVISEALSREIPKGRPNSTTPYRCPKHDIYSCRCRKLQCELHSRYYTIFAHMNWHSEFLFNNHALITTTTTAIADNSTTNNNSSDLTMGEFTSRLSSVEQRKLLQNKFINNSSNSSNNQSTSHSSGQRPDDSTLFRLANLYHLADYLRLGYTVHLENSATVMAVDNLKYIALHCPKEVIKPKKQEEKTHAEILDDLRAELRLEKQLKEAKRRREELGEPEPAPEELTAAVEVVEEVEEVVDEEVVVYLQIDNTQLNRLFSNYLRLCHETLNNTVDTTTATTAATTDKSDDSDSESEEQREGNEEEQEEVDINKYSRKKKVVAPPKPPISVTPEDLNLSIIHDELRLIVTSDGVGADAVVGSSSDNNTSNSASDSGITRGVITINLLRCPALREHILNRLLCERLEISVSKNHNLTILKVV